MTLSTSCDVVLSDIKLDVKNAERAVKQTMNFDTIKKPTKGNQGFLVYAILAITIFVSVCSYPYNGNKHFLHYVWWYSWLTAIATGLGALPFIWLHDLEKYWLGVCNGLAAGMMLAATFCLFYEGIGIETKNTDIIPVYVKIFVGIVSGVFFIKFTKAVLDNYEDIKVAELGGMDARKAILIVGVMTLHSISEGIGVGVSFGGDGGNRRGFIVSCTMAIHNIPEGLAICLVLIPRGLGILHASLWSIFSSLPQPLFAVPSYLFIEQFLPLLPVGLGFAGGAMAYVACFELIVEAIDDTLCWFTTAAAVIFSFISMLNIQYLVTGEMV